MSTYNVPENVRKYHFVKAVTNVTYDKNTSVPDFLETPKLGFTRDIKNYFNYFIIFQLSSIKKYELCF